MLSQSGHRLDGGGADIDRRLRLLVICCVLIGSLPAAGRALSYPRSKLDSDRCGQAQQIYYEFHTTYSGEKPKYKWTSSDKDAFRSAVSRWEGIKERNGTRLAAIDEETSSHPATWHLYFVANPNGQTNLLGSTFCSGRVEFDATLKSDREELKDLVVHEFGHVFGLKHSARGDSLGDGDIPTMFACQRSTWDVPAWDDWASLSYHMNGVDGNRLNANPSFENGFSAWKSRHADYKINEGGGASSRGSKHLRLARKGSDTPGKRRGVVEQVVRIRGLSGFRIGAFVKKFSTSHTGRVIIGGRRRPVKFGDSDPGCSNSPELRKTYDWVTPLRKSVRPTESWSYYRTGSDSPYDYEDVGNGQDILVWVRNAMQVRDDRTTTPYAAIDDAGPRRG